MIYVDEPPAPAPSGSPYPGWYTGRFQVQSAPDASCYIRRTDGGQTGVTSPSFTIGSNGWSGPIVRTWPPTNGTPYHVYASCSLAPYSTIQSATIPVPWP